MTGTSWSANILASVDDPKRREDDPPSAIGMAPTKVVEVDLIRTAANRQPVFERPLRQATALVLFEDVRRRNTGLPTRGRRHLLHVCGGILVSDDVDGRRKFNVAADVV